MIRNQRKHRFLTLAKNPQPVQPVSDSNNQTLILTNDKMLSEESELPTQELSEPELVPSEEQRIDTPAPKKKKDKDWSAIVGTRDQLTRESKK